MLVSVISLDLHYVTSLAVSEFRGDPVKSIDMPSFSINIDPCSLLKASCLCQRSVTELITTYTQLSVSELTIS